MKAGVPNIREYEAKMEEDLTMHEQQFSSLKREHAELEAEVERMTSSLIELRTKLERLEQNKKVFCLHLSLVRTETWWDHVTNNDGLELTLSSTTLIRGLVCMKRWLSPHETTVRTGSASINRCC